MPKIFVPLPETDESIVFPVIFDVVRNLMALTGIPDDGSVKILMPGSIEKSMQPGSAIGTKPLFPVKFPFGKELKIKVNEEYDRDRILSTVVFRPEHLYIYRDDRIEANIRPVYSHNLVTISVSFRAQDKVSAEKWRDDIRIRLGMQRVEHTFDVKYHYLIPEEMLIILRELHRMRENVMGYGEDWDTYFGANSSSRLTMISNQSGQRQRLGMPETQTRIVGWFDFEEGPEKGNKEDDADTWTINFDYKFRYDKPVGCSMEYPLVVHNQVVKQKFREGPSERPPYTQYAQYSYSGLNLAYFEAGQQRSVLNNQSGFAIPSWDEFIPLSVVPKTTRLFTALSTIDSTQPRFIMNLLELESLVLDNAVCDLLRKERSYMTQAYKSVFSLSLYRNRDLMPDGSLVVDADMNVHMTFDPSLRDYWHLRLALVNDLTILPRDVLDRLRESAEALIKIISVLYPGRPLPIIIGKDYMRRDDLNNIIDVSNDRSRHHYTVQTLFLETDQSLNPIGD